MASYNKVLLIGNLTRDPELRYLPSGGTAVAELGLAVNETYKNKAGELVEQTCFVDVVVWSRQAETCGKYLHKGSPVLVEGRLQLDKWTSKEGENRSKLRVRAERVQFLGAPRTDAVFEDGDRPAERAATAPGASGVAAAAPTAGEDDDFPPAPMGSAGLADEDNLPF